MCLFLKVIPSSKLADPPPPLYNFKYPHKITYLLYKLFQSIIKLADKFHGFNGFRVIKYFVWKYKGGSMILRNLKIRWRGGGARNSRAMMLLWILQYIVQCTVHCTVYYTVHCTVYCTLHCTIYCTVHCTVHWTVYCTVHCTVYCTVYTPGVESNL